MATPDMGMLARIAMKHGIPVSILYAVGSHESSYSDDVISGKRRGSSGEVGAFQFMEATLKGYGYSPQDIVGNLELQADIAATKLSADFKQYGSWERTLSAYNSGGPDNYKSNPQIANYVNSVMGISASNIDYGQSAISSDPTLKKQAGDIGFQSAQQAFERSLGVVADMGGIVSHDQIKSTSNFYSGLGGTISGGFTGQGPQSGAFPGDPYPAGQCTWFVAGLAPQVKNAGNLGNATDWLSNAQQQGLPTGNQAQVGAVVVYHSGGGYSEAGHVGVVTQVNSNGTFQVASDNWGGVGQVNVGTSTMSDVEGFILPTSPTEGMQTAQSTLQATGSPSSIQQAVSMGQQAQPQAVPHALATPKQDQVPQQTHQDQLDKNKDQASADEVSKFAQDAQQAGLNPADIQHLVPILSPLLRKFLGQKPDLNTIAQYKGLTPDQMLQKVRDTPHPNYTGFTGGQIWDKFSHASMLSGLHLDRNPYIHEVTNFLSAGMDHKQMNDYYQQQGAKETPSPAPQQQQDQGQPAQALGSRRF